jgi:CheY-like chemotaxis protein
MKDIAEWLLSIETMSGSFYERAAQAFRNNEELSRFLSHLAQDEMWHRHIISTANAYLREGDHPKAAISMDPETREKIEAPFREGNRRLDEGTLTTNDVVSCIAMTEFSEWNDVFQYVINSLKDTRKEFEPVAARMQQHKRYIENYLNEHADIGDPLLQLRGLPPVWRERFLVVDDFPPIREFLSALLSTKGTVETAANGKEGLEKVGRNYFDAIISDIDMPVMNGTEFYRRATQGEPRIGNRFLFLTGNPEPELVDFLGQNGLRYLAKPAPLADVTNAVDDILLRASETAIGDN